MVWALCDEECVICRKLFAFSSQHFAFSLNVLNAVLSAPPSLLQQLQHFFNCFVQLLGLGVYNVHFGKLWPTCLRVEANMLCLITKLLHLAESASKR